MESVEVCIVGGGVTGLAAAWRLGLAGREALLLERFEIDHVRGSSHGATRIFRFAYPDPLYVSMAEAAYTLWRDLQGSSHDEILHITGGLDVGDPEMLERVAGALGDRGAAVERLTDSERRMRFPWLAVDGPAVYSPDTGVLAAARALTAMAAAARTTGVEIREGVAVRSLEPDGDGDGVTVRTEAGDIKARRCIVAAGAWARPLLEPAGIALPLHITREQVFYFRPAKDILPFIHYGTITRYGVPAFAGAAGVKLGEHMTGEETSADGRSFEMDPEGAARVAAYVERTLPDMDPEPVAFETCLYTMTPDKDFIIDTRGPLIIASACSGHGFKFATLLGETLARLASDAEPAFPIERFALDRFGS